MNYVVLKRFVQGSCVSCRTYWNVDSHEAFCKIFDTWFSPIEEDKETDVLSVERSCNKSKVVHVGDVLNVQSLPLRCDEWRMLYFPAFQKAVLKTYDDCKLTPPSDYSKPHEIRIEWYYNPKSILPF